MTYRYSEIVPVIGLTLGKKKRKTNQYKSMQMHGHFKTETNNTSCKGNTALWQLPTRKIRKFIKSKFKILTCVVLLGRLNTMRGISAGKYDKGNKSIIMRGNMSRGNIYCYQLYIYCLSLALPCYSQNHKQLLKHFLFAFKIFFDQIFVHYRFLYVLWEVSTGDAVMTKLFFQRLCHALSYVAALMI